MFRDALAIRLIVLIALAFPASAWPDDLALWRIVDAGCNGTGAKSEQDLQCDKGRGVALLKDICGPTHYLLIPTARRRGIESPELLHADEPNYFRLAWEARRAVLVAAAKSRPGEESLRADDIGLAINSRDKRSQQQLHIHIDRVRPEVLISLRATASSSAPTRITLRGHEYRLMHVASFEPSPFRLLSAATGDVTPDARAHETIAVIADGAGGFYVLGSGYDSTDGNSGHAEDLLIERPSCKLIPRLP